MTKPDAKLLRLEAEFKAASERESKALDKVEELYEELNRIKSRIPQAERDLEKAKDAAGHLFHKVFRTRAKTVAGLNSKVRARKIWNCDAEEIEREILESLVADIKAMIKSRS